MADPWAEFRVAPPQDQTQTFGANNVPQSGAEPSDPWAEFRAQGGAPEPTEFDIMARNQVFRDWQSKRGLIDRARDTAAFVASVPVRMLTRGQYGAADIVGTLSPSGGAALARSEGDFVRANPDLMWTLGAAGEVAGAFPPAAGVRARNIANPNAEMAALRAARAADDIAAAERIGVDVPGFAYNQGPAASVAKQISETPIIGAPVRGSLERAYGTAARAANDIAESYSPVATPESAGTGLQQGMMRFRTARLDELPAATVEGVGLPANVQAPANRVMSQGARQAAAQAAPIREAAGINTAQTSRGVTVPSARPRDEFLATRSTPENLTDTQLARLIRTPASETSAAARAEAIYERAWRMVPELTRTDGTRNPNLLNPTNTRLALRAIEGNIANNISGQAVLNGDLVARLTNPQANMTLSDMRAVRTEVGRALNNASPLAPSTLDRAQLKQLYGALSRDIEIGLETLANRAAIGLTRSTTARDYVTPDTARRAANALRAMRTADRYFRLSMNRMDRFAEIVNAKSPELAVQRVMRAALDGTKGDAQLMRQALAVLQPAERNQIAAVTIREMGRPAASARGMAQDAGFSFQSFTTRWAAMSPQAKAIMFDGPHRQALDDLAATANRLANVEALTNTSRTGTNTLNIGGVLAAGGAVATGAVDTLTAGLGSAAAGLGVGYLMSRPSYARWLARYLDLRARQIRAGDRSPVPMDEHIRRLGQMAGSDPALQVYYDTMMGERRGR